MRKDELENLIAGLIKNKVAESLKEKGLLPEAAKATAKKETKPVVTEAVVAQPSNFVVKTEKLSKDTKQSHEAIYKKHIESFNKLSSELDAANTHEAGSFASAYRSLKMDECANLNAVKLHELYFTNISDLASAISLDTIPYIKLSRDFGSFEKWQFDFMACAMSAREGWAMTVYEPYKNVYMNICVDANDVGIPVGAVPVLVLDLWSHAFFKDYQIDKKSYIVSMMKEINWDVVEARMILAEKSELNALYKIRPMYDNAAESMLSAASIQAQPAPIDKVNNGLGNQVSPTTPAAPDNNELKRGF
jgi:Fe-Mn family superoxide dismutase